MSVYVLEEYKMATDEEIREAEQAVIEAARGLNRCRSSVYQAGLLEGSLARLEALKSPLPSRRDLSEWADAEENDAALRDYRDAEIAGAYWLRWVASLPEVTVESGFHSRLHEWANELEVRDE